MKAWRHSGRPWVWLTSGAVSLSLLAMLALLTGQSLRLLWPQPIYRFELISPPGVLWGERVGVQLMLADAQGQRQVIPLSDIDSLWYPIAMSLGQKLRHLAAQTWRFVSLNDPVREGRRDLSGDGRHAAAAHCSGTLFSQGAR